MSSSSSHTNGSLAPNKILKRVQKDFNKFVNGPYSVFVGRATEIENFPLEVVTWVEEEAQKHPGLVINHREGRGGYPISIRKSPPYDLAVEKALLSGIRDTLVKRY